MGIRLTYLRFAVAWIVKLVRFAGQISPESKLTKYQKHVAFGNTTDATEKATSHIQNPPPLLRTRTPQWTPAATLTHEP